MEALFKAKEMQDMPNQSQPSTAKRNDGGKNCEAQAERSHKRRQARQWQDVMASATILTNHSEEAQRLLFMCLGFLPDEPLLIRFEPFVRSLIESLEQGALSESAFEAEVGKTAVELRHAFMEQDGWIDYLTYDEVMLQAYETYLPEQAKAARSRIERICGFSPDLAWSLEAELYLRGLLINDNLHLGDASTPTDYRLATVVYYRRALLTQGRQFAEALPLLGKRISELFEALY